MRSMRNGWATGRAWWATAIVCGLGTAVGGAAEPPRLRVVRINEMRTREPGAAETIPAPGQPAAAQAGPGQMSVVFEATAPGLAAATHWGRVKLADARLDTGAPLKFQPLLMGADVSKDCVPVFQPPVPPGARPPAPQDRQWIELGFDLPPRSAKSVSGLKGSVEFLVGKPEEAVVKQLPLIGRPLEHPLFTKAGLKLVRVAAAKEAQVEGATVIAFDLTGDVNKILEIFAVNARGEDLQADWGIDRGAAQTKIYVAVDGAGRTDFGLALSVVPAQQVVTIPFETGTLELP